MAETDSTNSMNAPTQDRPLVEQGSSVQTSYVPLGDLSYGKYADKIFNIRGKIDKLTEGTSIRGDGYLALRLSDETGSVSITLFDNHDEAWDAYWQVKKGGLAVGSSLALHKVTYDKMGRLCASHADTLSLEERVRRGREWLSDPANLVDGWADLIPFMKIVSFDGLSYMRVKHMTERDYVNSQLKVRLAKSKGSD